MTCYRSGGCGQYEMRSCSECPASKPEYLIKNTKSNMEFNIKELEELVEKVRCATQLPVIHLFCPPGLVNDFKEYWSKDKSMKVEVHAVPKICSTHFDYEEDKIYVIPTEESYKPIKVVIPEEQERLRKYLGLESEE